jgi:hypothetical protein
LMQAIGSTREPIKVNSRNQECRRSGRWVGSPKLVTEKQKTIACHLYGTGHNFFRLVPTKGSARHWQCQA